MNIRHVSPQQDPVTEQRKNAVIYGAIVGIALCAALLLSASGWVLLATFLAASVLAAAVLR